MEQGDWTRRVSSESFGLRKDQVMPSPGGIDAYVTPKKRKESHG